MSKPGSESYRRWREKERAAFKDHSSGYRAKRDEVSVPDAPALEARAALLADRRDLTGRVFGDPLPGRSALDRRRAGHA